MDKKEPKTKGRKKKITKCLNIADFTRPPSYRRSQRNKNKKAKRRENIPLAAPPRKENKTVFNVEPTFVDDAVEDIVPLTKSKTSVARKYASTNPGYW